MFPNKINNAVIKKIQTLTNKIVWKDELLKFQLQDANRSFVDLKVNCTDGYFLVHKIVFAMSSRIKFEEKNSRSMDVWIVNHSLQETAKIMLLAYTGEILLVNNWTYLDELIDIFRLSQENLNWGVPYNEQNNLFSTLAQKKVRATKCCSSTNTQEEILIFGNGDIMPVKNLKVETTESSPHFQNVGYSCSNCSCIFTDETDFTTHEEGCKPQCVVVKTEFISPSKPISTTPISASPTSSTICTVEHPSQKRVVVSPEQIKCFICKGETNSVMQLVDHFRAVHEVVPGKDYCLNPIKCNGCNLSRSGRNMSEFLYHVAKCKTDGGENLFDLLDNIVKGQMPRPNSPIREISNTPKRKREPQNRTKRKLTKEENFDDTMPLPKVDNSKSGKPRRRKSDISTTNAMKNVIKATNSVSKDSSNATPRQEVLTSIEIQCEVKNDSPTPSNVAIESMKTNFTSVNHKESQKKATKFVIPKKLKSFGNFQHKSLKNSKTYHRSLKTPENPDKNITHASFRDKRLAVKENCKSTLTTIGIQNAQLLNAEISESSNVLIVQPEKSCTYQIENSQQSKSVQIEKSHGELAPEKNTLSIPCSDVRRRLLFLGNTPISSSTLLNKDIKKNSFKPPSSTLTEDTHEKNTIATTLALVLENNLGNTEPKRKKQKTSPGNYSTTQQQVLKHENHILTKPAESISKSTKIVPKSISKYKWLCTYCKSKFTSQVFYMRHCCKTATFPSKQQIIGKPTFSSYVISTRRRHPFLRKKNVQGDIAELINVVHSPFVN